MADVLPGYRWNARLGRYISQTTGRFVGRQAIVSLLDSHVAGSEERLARLVTTYSEGNVSPSVFAEQMRSELKRIHLQARALGAGGWDRLTQSDYGSIGGKLRADYQRIEQLARGIADGDVSLPQALNRAQGYVGNARIGYWDAQREREQPQPGNVIIERRVLGAAEHCQSCLDYYAEGWQLQGILPSPGTDSECGTHCRCHIISREVNRLIVGEYIGTRR